MDFPRSSGILLHPTSLPGRFGIGDMGPAAYEFVDFLVASGQQIWQVLPLGPTGYGNSPYLSYSAAAGNPLLISLEVLQQAGHLSEADLAQLPEFPADTVDFDRVIATKFPLLRRASEHFRDHASPEERQAFEAFCAEESYWLDDYAFFMALKDAHGDLPWNQWDEAIARREPAALAEWRSRLANDIFFRQYTQFEFFRQWAKLRAYANEQRILIVGDIPFYVAHDSADVWAQPDNFCLDEETGAPALMAGVPPDYFSATGQLWGNPVYNWEHLENQGFQWWVQRFKALLRYVDVIRIDHFRGFEAYWAVPMGEETAVNGEWIKAPGETFFQVLGDRLGKLPIVAEDLGVITPEVETLRDQFGFPGMKILQFAFGSGPGNPYLPFNYQGSKWIVYTGTHDNNTTLGWFSQCGHHEKEGLLNYLGCTGPHGIHWDMIRLALSSTACQAIIPLQDVLGLGSEGRMNTPSEGQGNWGWRYRAGALAPELRDRLRSMTETYGRLPY